MSSGVNVEMEIERLIKYAETKGLIDFYEALTARNGLIDYLGASGAYEGAVGDGGNLNDILNRLLRHCFEKGILADSTVVKRALVSAKIMGFVSPSPSVVVKKFEELYANSPMEATDYLYNLSVDVNYINISKSDRSYCWEGEQPYGTLMFTNSFHMHQESDVEIAERLKTVKPDYPKCIVCIENVGFSGNLWHLAKQNLRVVPLDLNNERYYMQISPLQSYGERFFVSHENHEPMYINKNTFAVMIDFISKFPHCFIGTEADLEGLGNAFLSHANFQGGCHVFPIEAAAQTARYGHASFKGTRFSLLNWPVSTIRIESDDTEELAEAAAYITDYWRGYSDTSAGIVAFTEETPHNSVTTAARKNITGHYEIDIFLRNNRTDDGKPHGIFCHDDELLNVRRGASGLIDILGLGVFDETFDTEMVYVISMLLTGKPMSKEKVREPEKYLQWIEYLSEQYGREHDYDSWCKIFDVETSEKFAKALEACGVFKLDEKGARQFMNFMYEMNFYKESDD